MKNSRFALAVLFGLPVLMLMVWLVVDLGWLGLPLQIAAIAAGLLAYRWTLSIQFFGARNESAAERPLTISLPSADSNVRFVFSGSVRWQSLDRMLDEATQAELAADAIVDRALELTSTWQPSQWELAGHKLGIALSSAEPNETRRLVSWASDVRLALSDTDRSHLEGLAEARRQTERWTVEVAKERELRAYLKNEALSSADEAVVWWLSRNESSVERAVELSEVLSTLSDLATGRTLDDPDGVLVEAIRKLAADEQRPLADEIAHSLTEAGLPEEAANLRRTFRIEDRGAQLYDLVAAGRAPAAGEPTAR